MSGATALAGLAARSVRTRGAGLTATALAVLLGTALIGAFATLVETALADGVEVSSRETLVTMGGVVGAWGAVIVLFSVASTVGVVTTQRQSETRTLRTLGATPRQVRSLLRWEVAAVSLVAAAVGAGLAALGGRGLLALVRGGDLVATGTAFGGGPASLSLAAGLVVVTALLASGLAARRALRLGRGARRGDRWRRVLGVLLVGYGVAMAVVTITVTAHADDPFAAMQTSGSSSILVAVGLALWSPLLLRSGGRLLRPLTGSGATSHLATATVARRAPVLAGVLGPVIVLTSAAIGTLMLVGTDARTLDRAALTAADQDVARTISLLNNVVVGMIALFAAIMVVNALVAVVAGRREEMHRLRLIGATPGQLRSSLVAEAAVVAVVGVVVGAVASLATVVPFAVARDEGVVPDGQLWLPPLVVAGALLLTLGAAWLASRRLVAVGPAVGER